MFKAYLEQFQRDFSLFLKLRSEEMTSGGRMVLTLIGRKDEDPSSGDCFYGWELFTKAIMEMVSQVITLNIRYCPFNSQTQRTLDDALFA